MPRNPNGVEQIIDKLLIEVHEVRIDEVFWSHLYLYLHFWLLDLYSCSKTLRLTSSNRPVYLRKFSLFVTVLLEEILPRMVTLFFCESTTSWAYFEESGINSIFHWYAHWGNLVRLSFVVFVDTCLYIFIVNKEMLL